MRVLEPKVNNRDMAMNGLWSSIEGTKERMSGEGSSLAMSRPRPLGRFLAEDIAGIVHNTLAVRRPARGHCVTSVWPCRRLAVLDISGNALTGSIPPLLFDNRLSSELPPSLGELRLLETLRAGGNPDLAGPIPDSFSKLSNLVVLGLADTKISGPLPASLGTLPQLQKLLLWQNALTGPIPESFGNLISLVSL
ncbi:hypothetical protein BAE44_0020406, partial [Dichanthelium oligosanthes]